MKTVTLTNKQIEILTSLLSCAYWDYNGSSEHPSEYCTTTEAVEIAKVLNDGTCSFED